MRPVDVIIDVSVSLPKKQKLDWARASTCGRSCRLPSRQETHELGFGLGQRGRGREHGYELSAELSAHQRAGQHAKDVGADAVKRAKGGQEGDVGHDKKGRRPERCGEDDVCAHLGRCIKRHVWTRRCDVVNLG